MPDDSLILPDGRVFTPWEQPHKPARTYHVSQAADEEGDGSEKRPFRTIQAAADVVGPGERVLIHEGVYRETVRPRRGGDGPMSMITYEAAPGEEVVITGAERYDGPWRQQERWMTGPRSQRVAPAIDGPPVYHMKLPPEWFVGYQPFGMINLSEHGFSGGKGLENFPQNHLWKLLLKRGLIFQDGRRLQQVRRLGDLNDSPGRYWVESTSVDVYVRPFDEADPSGSQWEVTAREQCFAPEVKDLKYIHVKGLTIRHAADGFSWPQRAALSASHGTHWIIEGCRVHDVNANCVDIGVEHTNLADKPGHGYHVIRRNVIQRGGLAGLVGICGSDAGVNNLLVEGNLVEGCGWHDIERGYESANIKIHRVRDSVFRRNLIRDGRKAAGLWLDFGIENVRVTNNVLLDHETGFGAVFIEAAKVGTVRIDHNVIVGSRQVQPIAATDTTPPVRGGHGVYSHDSDRLMIDRNLIVDCKGTAAHVALGQVTRHAITGRGATCRENSVRNNLVVNCAQGVFFGRPFNHANGNVYVGLDRNGPFRIGEPEEHLDWEGWRVFLGHDLLGAYAPEDARVEREGDAMVIHANEAMREFLPPHAEADESRVAGPSRVLVDTPLSLDPRQSGR